ncbi:MAG: ATP-dependent RNA helicase RhlB [Pseudomonadota bacterium]
MSQEHLSELEFATLELPDSLQRGIAQTGFQFATPIQAQTLPMALKGSDVAGQAQTGTGKTAAFVIAMYNYLLTNPIADEQRQQGGIRALVLAPTRELAVQIADDARALGEHTGLKIGLAYGGTDYDKQRTIIENGIDILIGTPGRIIDYFKQRVFHMKQAQVLVLDEADRMFDLGFIKDIRFLLRRLPPANDRLNLLFSATLSYRVMELAAEHMNDPELIRIEPEKVTADRVEQSIYYPSNEEKIPLLIKLMREMDIERTMVFVNTKREAERLEDTLNANDIVAKAISGDVPQKKRLRMLQAFQAGELNVLIGTDVASRGLHIDDVSHVFNYDLPQDREDYVHRIGRTARAGASGVAVSFGCEQYVMSLPDIEDYIGFRIPVASFDHESLPKITRPPRRPRKPRNDSRRRSSGSSGGNRPRRRN